MVVPAQIGRSSGMQVTRRGEIRSSVRPGHCSGCESTPAIRRDTNPEAAFGSYKTFGFLSPLATDKFPYESLLTQHLKDATRHTMESKGYVFSNGTPDLLLNFYVNIQDR